MLGDERHERVFLGIRDRLRHHLTAALGGPDDRRLAARPAPGMLALAAVLVPFLTVLWPKQLHRPDLFGMVVVTRIL